MIAPLGRRACSTANLSAARTLFDPLLTDGTYKGIPRGARKAFVQAQGGTVRWTDNNLSGFVGGVFDNGSGLCRCDLQNHGLKTGDQITIFDLIGATAANGTFMVTVIDKDTVDLQGSTFAAEPSVGAISAIATTPAGLYRATSASHGLTSGMLAYVGNVGCASPGGFGAGEFDPNGLWQVHVIDANTFDLLGSRGAFGVVLTGSSVWFSIGQWYGTANLPTSTVGQRIADGDVIELRKFRTAAFIQETGGVGSLEVSYSR